MDKFKLYTGKPYMNLYKYYSNVEYVKDVVLNNRIHLEKPNEYNDIYDSAFIVDSEALGSISFSRHDEIIPMLRYSLPLEYKNIVDNIDISLFDSSKTIRDIIDTFCRHNKDINMEIVEKCFINVLSNNTLQQAPNIKLSCFSERKDSLLMWAYYANNYQGYCVEFDFSSDDLLKNNLHKVQYSRCFKNQIGTFDNYFIKAECWQHEQEWRIAVETKNDFLPTSAIKSIYIGPRTPYDEFLKNIWIPCDKEKIQVFKAKPSLSDFKLNFELIPSDLTSLI